MNFIGRLGAWIVYFGVVGLVLNMGWQEPLKNRFVAGDKAQSPPMAATDPALTIPSAPPTTTPQVANGQVEHVDNDVRGNRRMLIFSTPAP
ncbi:MAG TPA: hypothetical protein VGM54_18465 [Chthoniobacter sp.]|jgi:hypothetical protein